MSLFAVNIRGLMGNRRPLSVLLEQTGMRDGRTAYFCLRSFCVAAGLLRAQSVRSREVNKGLDSLELGQAIITPDIGDI